MKDFIYSYPTKVYFGDKAAAKMLPAELAKTGKTVMLAYGKNSIKKSGVYDEICGYLKEAGKEIVDFPGIMPNPTYKKVQEGAALAKEKNVDFILAVGGGSVIDCCKIIAAQAAAEKDIWEMEFKDHVYPTEFLPMGAIVTASGTGAEMNNGAVITNEDTKEKAGVLGAYAEFAVLDVAYTMSLPPRQVISGAFDTLSHSMETYLGSPREVTLSDEIAEAVMRNVIRNIRLLLKDINDKEARTELMWASAMAENGILKIGKVTDFQAHQIEHQLGAYTDCNHGQGLAVIHPVLYRHICKDGVRQFARMAQMVWEISPEGKSEEELAEAGIEALAEFVKEIGLPSTFRDMGITDKSVLKKVADTCNLTAGCCKKLSREEVLEILEECWE
ncbi:iron-containing alcohol dehydrogenase [Petralouisia muris]|uniref:Iron-containing alcohol dehydrogenase n=1 Tax=Petralouisia muris TaxID=3032872 RepID=A0AC61RV66_9FIRM|nr:iron-containing alcohol dehydrogenase [Petralouisia muris]TGY95838.1 iron-containing alcohol dehydrogenase [Petralouisia muris]